MLLQLALAASVLGFGFMALLYAKKYGAKSEALKQEKERLLNEARERQRAQEIIRNINNFTDDDIDRRLQNITKKQQ